MSAAARACGLVLVAASGAWAAAAAPPVRFPAVRLAGGGVAAAHASVSGDPSDATAAKRRLDILRSAWVRATDRRALRGGEVVLATDPDLPAATREALLRELPGALAALFERDGWPKPFSAKSPLLLEVVSAPVSSAAGWEGRERDGSLRAGVVLVSAAMRDVSSTVLDAVHHVALLSVRQSAPDEAGWAAEAVAEYAARRAAGAAGPPVPEDDVLLQDAGVLTQAPTLAAFLEALEPKLSKGGADVREAWEASGTASGDDAEAFLRDVAARSGAASLPDALASAVAARIASAASRGGAPRAAVSRRTWLLGPVPAAAPAPLGWRRASFATEDERGGLELNLPDAGFRAARVLLFYRGDRGAFDALTLVPGETRLLPGSGASGVHVVLADGDAGELPLEVRREPEYPAALSSTGARWSSGAVQITWSTSQHRDLLAWVVERREETLAGEGAPSVETLPASAESPEATSYLFVDREARPSSRYRYRVLALTTDGLLSEAFESRVETR
jgi:hypothetical protein